MAARDGHLLRHHRLQIDALLLARDGRRRLEGRAEHNGHPVRDAAEDAAAAVRLGDDFPVFDREGVVILAAAQLRHAEARAKFHALDRRDAEKRGGDPVFHTSEHRIAKARGRAENRAFDDAADAVTSLARRRDGFAHLLAARIADDGELLVRSRACQLTFVRNARDGGDAAHDLDSFAREDLQADAARDAQRCGQAA